MYNLGELVRRIRNVNIKYKIETNELSHMTTLEKIREEK